MYNNLVYCKPIHRERDCIAEDSNILIYESFEVSPERQTIADHIEIWALFKATPGWQNIDQLEASFLNML